MKTEGRRWKNLKKEPEDPKHLKTGEPDTKKKRKITEETSHKKKGEDRRT